MSGVAIVAPTFTEPRRKEMNQVHLLCSTNWPPNATSADRDRMLAPLRTVLDYLSQNSYQLTKLILLGGNQSNDLEYSEMVLAMLAQDKLNTDFEAKVLFSADEGISAEIANHVSRSAEDTALEGASLMVDLTSGPKDRAAVLFAAGSAIPNVRILYAEATGRGTYAVREISRLDSYNRWLGRHGIRVRNYRDELRTLAARSRADDSSRAEAEVMVAISDLLGNQSVFSDEMLSTRVNIVGLAEWAANQAVPKEIFKLSKIPQSWQSHHQGETCDADIRKGADEWHRSAGRASQLAYQLRCLFAHSAMKPRRLQPHDAIALLDALSFIAHRLTNSDIEPAVVESSDEVLYIAVDGDDVGRRFEGRLANCVDQAQVSSLRQWSFSVHRDLSDSMMTLAEQWDASFIARTGDGFLASFPSAHLDNLTSSFRPTLLDATVTTGIGRCVKDAYLALKLGKAKNRGGGFFLSLQPPEERTLWLATHGNGTPKSVGP